MSWAIAVQSPMQWVAVFVRDALHSWRSRLYESDTYISGMLATYLHYLRHGQQSLRRVSMPWSELPILSGHRWFMSDAAHGSWGSFGPCRM